VKYLNAVCSQYQKENGGGWSRRQDDEREINKCGKGDRNK
jgi:hypothetical protein